MTHIEDHSREGIADNSELRLLRQLSELLDGQQEDDKLTRKIGALALSPPSSGPPRFLTDEVVFLQHSNSVPAGGGGGGQASAGIIVGNKNVSVFFNAECVDEGIEFDEMNGSGGAAAVGAYLDKMLSHEEEDDEQQEDENAAAAATLTAASSGLSSGAQAFLLDEAADETGHENEPESEEASAEIMLLERFKQVYQNATIVQEHKFHRHFEKFFNLLVSKRLCSKSWLTGNYSHKNMYFLLYAVRILLRSAHFQKLFIQTKNSFNILVMLLNKYIKIYQTANKNILISAHIIDHLLNISGKILCSDVFLAAIEQRTSKASSNPPTPSAASNDIIAAFFDGGMHLLFMQLVEKSNELCHVHSALDLLLHIYQISPENRARLTDDLDLTDQLLLMLQEYDETSKRQASKLLSQLCTKERIRKEIASLDGIQILLSLLNIHNNFDTVWNVIWCLVQLCALDENRKEIRLMGGIPLVLSLLCDTHFDEAAAASGQKDDAELSHRHLRGKLQIQAASCALVGELAINEINSYQIVNSNGVYLVASKLLLSSSEPAASSSGGGALESSSSGGEKSHEVQRLHRNVWRTLRLLFSTERHRSLIKKIIPYNMLDKFVDIGNYKKDLKLYQPLLESFYLLSKEDLDALKNQIKSVNQTQVPTVYINDFAVYETIGSGAFGRVFKVKKKNANYFLAMKEISICNQSALTGKSYGDFVSEVTIIRKNLKHPNIVRYLKTFKENDRLYVVMELIDGEPLSQHIRTLKERKELWPEEKIWNLFIQIVLALRYLHKEKGIVHRDLTSNNVMLSENNKIIITDFGLAKLKESDGSRMTSVVGTMFYSCPEIIKNEPYNDKADVWALGCLLYEMCCWEPPFRTQNMLALATRITTAEYDYERIARHSYSPLVSQVVQNCLTIEPTRRPDIVGVAALVADKILTYTDNVRYVSMHLEKRLEKEKNRTQKMLCNKQDLNLQHRSSSYQGTSFKEEKPESEDIAGSVIRSQPSLEVVVEPVSAFMSQPHSLSKAPSTLPLEPEPRAPNVPSSPLKVPPAEPPSSTPAPVSPSQSAAASQSQPFANSSSPNAKLPPLKNPKSKILMKNIMNKQQQQQQQQSQKQQQVTLASTKMGASNQSLDQESNTSGSNMSLQISQSSDATVRLGSYGGSSSEKQAAVVDPQPPSAGSSQPAGTAGPVVNGNSKIQRSSSSSVLEKRSSQTKKSRPTSASMLPVYKKLRPIEDPILQILDELHKIMFITQLPPSGKKNMKRKLVERYKRALFSKKRSSAQIKSELMKLIKNSTELVDSEMIGLKNFHGCGFDPTESGSNSENLSGLRSSAAQAAQAQSDVVEPDFEPIVNLNSITYEQFQEIIEELLQENDYHLENSKHLRELPSID